LRKSDWEELIERLIREGILRSEKVIRAMRLVHRVNFVPENMKPHSVADTPLPIGYGQTISAPHSSALKLN